MMISGCREASGKEEAERGRPVDAVAVGVGVLGGVGAAAAVVGAAAVVVGAAAGVGGAVAGVGAVPVAAAAVAVAAAAAAVVAAAVAVVAAAVAAAAAVVAAAVAVVLPQRWSRLTRASTWPRTCITPRRWQSMLISLRIWRGSRIPISQLSIPISPIISPTRWDMAISR